MRLNLLNFLIQTSYLVISEMIQWSYGEDIEKLGVHLIFFSLLLWLSDIVDLTIVSFIFYILMFAETGSYVMTGHDFDYQILSSLDIKWIFVDHKEYFGYLAAIIVFDVFVHMLQFKKYYISIKKTYLIFLASIFLMTLFFNYFINFYKSFYPFSSGFGEKNNGKIKLFISTPPKTFIEASRMKNRKNLIMIQLESFELQGIGPMNIHFPNLMPFLSNLSLNGLLFTNVISQPYTTWTSASVFASQCNIPNVVSEILFHKTGNDDYVDKWPDLPCLGHHFKNAGYNTTVASSGSLDIMGVMSFFKQYGYNVEDVRVNNCKHDMEFFTQYAEKFADMKVENLKHPFVYMISSSDTHPFFYVDKKCIVNQKEPRIIQSYNCLDQELKILFDGIMSNKYLLNTTDIMIYGDHLTMGTPSGVFEKNDRKMFLLFPFLKKEKNNKQSSIYDFAPTILDLLGIKAFPPLPFGHSLFDDNEVGLVPSYSNLNFIYNEIVVKKIRSKNRKAKCGGEDGLCQSDMDYFKDREYFDLNSTNINGYNALSKYFHRK